MRTDTNGKTQFWQYILYAFLLITLMLPNIYALFICPELQFSLAKKAGYLIVSLIIYILPMLFLRAKTYFIVEGIVSLLIAPVEIASLFFFESTTRPMFLRTIFETNFGEAREFLLSFLPFAIAVVIIWTAYFALTVKLVRNVHILSRQLRIIVLWALPIIGIIGFGYFYRMSRQIGALTPITDVVSDATDKMLSKFYKTFPADVYLAAYLMFEQNSALSKRTEKLSGFRFGINAKTDTIPETYILVIGETARWQNYGINGYERNTTPNLQKISNLVSYENSITQANLTGISVPLILSRYAVEKFDSISTEKTLPEAFIEAGFSLSWLTAQGQFSPVLSILEQCDNVYTTHKDFDNEGNYDGLLLQPFSDVLSDSQHPKKFIVVHLMGNHLKYNLRYPKEFERFTPALDDKFDYQMLSESLRNEMINAYDNAILYNDYIISELIKRLDRRGGMWAMLYLSDHGENLLDDERKLMVHGSNHVTPYEFRIPFIVAYSDDYANTYPEKIANIVGNKSKHISSHAVFHSLLDMADIGAGVVDKRYCIDDTLLISPDTIRVMLGTGRLGDFCY